MKKAHLIQATPTRLVLLSFLMALVAMISGCGEKKLSLETAVVMKQGQAGQTVAPDQLTARNGDQVRFLLTPAEAGYGYVFHQGSSGAFHTLFPVTAAGSAPNHVESNQALSIPPGNQDWLTFDEKPGSERMIVVYSKHKVNRLETLLLERTISSADIEAAIKELRATLPVGYNLEKKVEANRTVYQLKSHDPAAYIMADLDLRHQ